MTQSITKLITDKWKIILTEYEKVKNKNSTLFSSVNQLCETYKVSRKQIKKYYNRWLIAGKKEEVLLPRRRGPPKGRYRLLTKEQERIVVKIQRKLASTPFDVWCLIGGKWNVHPSVKTIARVLKRYPLNKKKEIIHRYERKIPGELIHGDTFDIPTHVFKDREKRFLAGMLDDCTRLTFTETIDKKRSRQVGKSFMRGGKWFDLHGVGLEEFMSDNGSEYTPSGVRYSPKKHDHPFEIMLEYLDIRHIYIKPYTPKTNGKIERFWRILREEFIAGLRHLTLNEFNENLKQFMYYYNYQRPHGGIKNKTPFQKLELVTETLG